jgi:uncharacterized phage infection (PIP) family protein YhgE
MADLESAAEAALAKVKEFTGDVDRAEDVLEALEQKLADVTTQIDGDWSAFQQAMGSLVEATQTERERMADDSETATDALDEVETAGGRLGSDGPPELEGSRGELAALESQTRAGQASLSGLMDGLEANGQALADRARAVEQQLQQALLEARDHLQTEVVTELQALHSDAQQRFEAAIDAVATDCEAAIADKLADFDAKLEEVRDLVEQQGFEDAKTHAAETTDEAVEAMQEALRQVMDELQGVAGTLAERVATVGTTAEGHREDVERTTGQLEQGLLDTHAQLETMLGALRKVAERLASLSFAP